MNQNQTRPTYVDTRAAAQFLGLSESTLEKLRFYRKPGPPFARFGNRIRYPLEGLREWAESRIERGAE